MVPVSNAWVEAHKGTLLPEMFVEITYVATDPTLQEIALVSGDASEADVSDAAELVANTDKTPEKYASLELGLWGLDGTFTHTDGSPEDPGYVSGQISDANGGFASYPTITIEFPSLQQTLIPGLTITWSGTYGQWATSYRVTAYNGSTQVARGVVTDNQDLVSTIFLSISGYSKIVIEVLKWSHPYCRARCSRIFLGVETVYRKTDLMGFEHSQSVDLLSASLPKNSITFKLRNEDNRWNPDNPTGNEQYLLEQQEIRVRYGMDIEGETEWIKGGTFWLSEWSTPSNGLEATFTARDLIEFMHEEYTGFRDGTLYAIANMAFALAGLPRQDNGDPRYVVSEKLKEYTTNFENDDTYTIVEVLQMVAHAGNAVFYQDRDGVVHIEPWDTKYSGVVIDQHISYAHPEYEFNKPLKAISVGYGEDQRTQITVSGRGEVQTVDNVMLRTQADAQRVGEKAREILESRKTISGEFRADVRLDALDPVIVTSKYASNIVAITDISYSTTGGAFKGKYTGRVVSLALETEKIYSGEIFAGEV